MSGLVQDVLNLSETIFVRAIFAPAPTVAPLAKPNYDTARKLVSLILPDQQVAVAFSKYRVACRQARKEGKGAPNLADFAAQDMSPEKLMSVVSGLDSISPGSTAGERGVTQSIVWCTIRTFAVGAFCLQKAEISNEEIRTQEGVLESVDILTGGDEDAKWENYFLQLRSNWGEKSQTAQPTDQSNQILEILNAMAEPTGEAPPRKETPPTEEGAAGGTSEDEKEWADFFASLIQPPGENVASIEASFKYLKKKHNDNKLLLTVFQAWKEEQSNKKTQAALKKIRTTLGGACTPKDLEQVEKDLAELGDGQTLRFRPLVAQKRMS